MKPSDIQIWQIHTDKNVRLSPWEWVCISQVVIPENTLNIATGQQGRKKQIAVYIFCGGHMNVTWHTYRPVGVYYT